LALLMCAACVSPPRRQAAPPPPVVGVIEVKPQPVARARDFPGRTRAVEEAEVRPQVTGIIVKRWFQEGAEVRKGQRLYTVDPEPYRIALAKAKARLASAQANMASARLRSQRDDDVLKERGVSQQEADDGRSMFQQAVAAVDLAKAEVEEASINLDRTEIRAPISGRIGPSNLSRGALVTTNQETALVTIQTLDPIYVDLAVPAQDAAENGGADNAPRVRILPALGSSTAVDGRLVFNGAVVDPSTNEVKVRAVFPNKGQHLLPGLFVRARLMEGPSLTFLAPKSSVTRTGGDSGAAMVLGAGGIVETRALKLGPASGTSWVIESGLRAGDRLIVRGLQNVAPGLRVTPVLVREGE
jgi:membrane fusion protein (multidrug efflux system)